MQDKVRRRQVIVDPQAQGKMILQSIWPTCTALAIANFVLGYFCVQLHEESLALGGELPSLVPVFVFAMIFMVMATGFIFYSARRMSHRIAGPVHQICRVLGEFRDGESSARIKLRKHDHLTNAADAINELLDWVSSEQPRTSGATEAESEPVSAGHEATSDAH